MDFLRTVAIFFFFFLTLAGVAFATGEDTASNFGMAFILIMVGLIGLISFVYQDGVSRGE